MILLALGCFVLSCSMARTAEQSKPFPVGDYQYTGFDSSGAKIVEGRLSITSVKSTGFEGEWQLSKIGNPERIGPQVGTGTLAGSIIEGKLYINLNPNMSDNNVNLTGAIEGARFQGTWKFVGYAGVLTQGTFEATRR